jgi:hypothetical protein
MKTSVFLKTLAAITLISLPLLISAQHYVMDPFTGVKAGSVFSIVLYQGNTYEVLLETDSTLVPDIGIKVKDNLLEFEYTGSVRNLERITAHVTAPQYLLLNGSSASSFKTEVPLNTPSLKLVGSGATSFTLEIETELLTSEFSGATNATLSGMASVHQLKASGASQLKAFELATVTTEVNISGASSAKVDASSVLTGHVSGVSTLGVKATPDTQTVELSGLSSIVDADNKVVTQSQVLSDTVRVRVGSREVTIVDGDDVTTRRIPKVRSFRKNWAGFELGINGLMTPDHSINLPSELGYLDLRYEKSVAVNLNLYQQNLALMGDVLGLYTGIGLGWNNYRLPNNILLVKGSHELEHIVPDTDLPYKNKLTMMMVNVPLMLELQTRSHSEFSKFHLAAGVNLGVRLSSHTKQVYKLDGKKDKVKTHEDFYINPFRYDLQARMGWGKINFFASYSLNSLFRDGKGPEVYPFSIGLRILNFD